MNEHDEREPSTLSGEALEALEALLEEHAERYPDLEAVDVYKLLHQAFCGPGHAAPLEADAWQALQKEAERVAAEQWRVREWEEAVEVLNPSSQLARVHLRPYLRAGGSLTRLHEAFMATAREVEPDLDGLKAALARVQQQLGAGALDVGFDLDAFRRVCGEAARVGYGALSHSAAYRELYAPAYRVVLLERLSG